MHVRVIVQRPAPGVQDAEEAEAIRADELRVGRQGAQRLAGGLEQRGVDHALVAASDLAQLRRQREGDQEVGARQQAIGLVLEPGLGLLLLAASGNAGCRRIGPPCGSGRTIRTRRARFPTRRCGTR